MAAEDALELPVGLTEKQFMQQVARLETRLAKMEGETISRFKKTNAGVSKTFDDLENRVNRSFKSIATAPLAALTAVLGAGQIVKMTGQWTDLTSRVNLAAGSMEKGTAVMGRVSEMARRTYSDLNLTAEGYMSFARVLNDLGVSTDKQLDFVESLNNALVVSGAKGDTAARVMEALSKAMALGKLSGDELNTVISSGGRVAQALAQSMGVTTLELRKLGTDGKIGRAELLNITSQMAQLRDEAVAMPATIQDGFMLLNNALLEYIGRGDEAVGISAAIADALILIADNFEEVADTAITAATVIAAAFMGRSIAGMITGLGAATGAVTKFLTAARGATTISGLAGAMGSLSAAAGPIGMILGAVVAGGLIYFTGKAREAEKQADEFRAELERMGLYAPKVVEANEAVGESLDKLTDEARLRKIKLLRDGLDGLRGGGIFDNSELDQALAKAREGIGLQAGYINPFGNEFGDGDAKALERIREIGFAYQANEISAQEFLAEAQKINDFELSQAAQDLLDWLIDIAARASGGATALASLGAPVELQETTAQLASMREQLKYISDEKWLDKNIVDSIEKIIAAAERGEISAQEAHDALAEIAKVDVNATDFISRLQPIIAAMITLKNKALEAASAVALAVADSSFASMGGGVDRGAEERRKAYLARQDEKEAREAFTAEIDRQNNLTREQIALESEVLRLRKKAADEGIKGITDEQFNELAEGNIAADAARRDAGKGGKGGGKGSKNTDLDGLVEDLQTERELLDEWYAENLKLLEEASEAELAILGGRDAAKERLEEEHQERMARIKEAGRQLDLQSALSAGAEVLGAMGSFNKKALKVSQAFAAAEALVSTYKGAAKELEKGTFGFATAAAVIAKGVAFVAAIRGTSEGGGGGGGARGGASAPAAQAQSPDKVANYQISGDVLGKQSTEALFRQINEGQKDGYTIHTVEWV